MKIFLGIILMFTFFSTDCYAENIAGEAAGVMEIERVYESVPDDIGKISGSLETDGMYDSAGALKRLWESCAKKIREEIKENLQGFFSLVLINLLCAFCSGLCQERKITEYINIAGISAVAAMYMGTMDGLVNETVEALTQINTYSKVSMPAIFTAAAAGGAVVSASARYAALAVGLEIIIGAARDIIVPMIYSYLALAIAKGLFNDPLIKSVQRFIRWLMGISMTVLVLTFSSYISITGAIGASADAMAIKTVRTVISNILPVVGGMLSDAASTVLASANVIKTSAGALSLVAICAMCAGPFIMLSIKMLLFKLAAAASDMVPDIRLSGFINDIGTALSFLLGLLGSVSIILFISIMSVIKAVSA